jgi:hypothetical protein
MQLAQPTHISWTGNVSTAWENIGNWSTNTLPTAASMVTIPTGRPRYPVVNANTTVKGILSLAGTSVTVAPGVLFNLLQ